MQPGAVGRLPPDYVGRQVTVMGLGRFGGGVAAAQFLAQHGARVTITDQRSASELADSIQQLSGCPIERWALGQHPPDVFAHCDLLVVNPAVPPDQPDVRAALARGVDVTTEIELFVRHNPARIIAVTGSNGKSTTTALIHHLLTRSGDDRIGTAWLGGNIGISLLDQLPGITADDWVILELSSFQLHLLRRQRFRPDIAVITNFTPNHLDWHGSVEHYRASKQGLLDVQRSSDVAILPSDDDQSQSVATDVPWRVRGRTMRFGLSDLGEEGASWQDGILVLRSSGLAHLPSEDAVPLSIPPQLPGQHNQKNVVAACCAAWVAGADPVRFSAALRTFTPLPHRLQVVAERHGRRFYNDSIATTPESAIQALRVFPGRIILLAGGYDKHQDLSTFVGEMVRRATAVVLMGQTAAELERRIAAMRTDNDLVVRIGHDFQHSFAQAVALSRPGDIVLLSPGCASYGWFRDYRDRGEQFIALARNWNPE